MGDIETKIREYIKLLKMARKPDSEEFFTTTKVAMAVMVIIGLVGFVIYLLMNVLPGAFK
ncbi:MAG TPA: protein translocase SEC61 complex subunit gamma [Archaeoglobaceae archaeon]|nr:protein translocase SEC61 complex subunit gamma [Archaeoglobaceae archaeon]